MSNDADARRVLKNHPEKMVHIYRRSIENGIKSLEKSNDFEERKRLRRSIEIQKAKLREWEQKAKRK